MRSLSLQFFLLITAVSLASSSPLLGSSSTGSILTNCQPVGPYPSPVAVIPSANERYLVVSASMHLPDDSDDPRSFTSSLKCGARLNLDALLMIEALLYSKDTYAIRSASQQIVSEPLGLMIVDNCGDTERTIQDLINFESCTLAFAPQGGAGGPMVFPDEAVVYFFLDYQPESRAGSAGELEWRLTEVNSHQQQKPFFGLTELDEMSEALVRSLVLVLQRLSYRTVAVVFADTSIGRHRWSLFKNISDSTEICTQAYRFSTTSGDQSSIESAAIDLLRSVAEDENVRVLVLLTDSPMTASVLDAARRTDLIRRWHWLGFSSSLKNIREDDETAIPPGTVMLARENDLTDFYEYVNAEQRDFGPLAARNPWLAEFYSNNPTTEHMCKNRSDCKPPSILDRFQENQWLQYNDLLTEVMATYDAVSTAWSDQGRSLSSDDNDESSRLESLTKSIRRGALSSVMVLNYRHTSKGWRFVRVGTIRDATEVRLDATNVQTYMQMDDGSSSGCPEACPFCDSYYKRRAAFDSNDTNNRRRAGPDDVAWRGDDGGRSTNRKPTQGGVMSPDFVHRTDLWACLLTGFAASMILMIFIYEAYAIAKICSRLPRASAVAQSGIFLSQGLLYGVFLQSVSVFSITLAPNFYVCAIQRFLPGIGCVLCYGVMFAKVLVLISARQGQYLAACYQALVVILFLAMQTIVSIHWLAAKPFEEFHFGPGDLTMVQNETSEGGGLFVVSLATATASKSYERGCNLIFFDYLKMLILPLCLIALCSVMGVLTRKNPYNYRETSFIALASFTNGAIWAVWICLAIFIKRDGLQDAALGYGMLTNAFVLTVIMFLPSSRQKTATGEGIGLNLEDVIGVKTNVSNGTATWANYLLGQPESISPISPTIPQQQQHQPKKKNAATQFTIHRTKRLNRPPMDPPVEKLIVRASAPSGPLALQKAMAVVNKHLSGARAAAAAGLDIAGGSAATLDIPHSSSIQSMQLPPPPPPMSLFNSHWKLQMNRRSPKARAPRPVPPAVPPPRVPADESPSRETCQDLMIYSSFAGSLIGEKPHQHPAPTSVMPKPVFPSVLTPARMLRGDAAEITYAHVCKHSHCPRRHAVAVPFKPLLRYPAYYLYRSRSSQDFRHAARQRCGLCLHSNLYRSRSFSDVNKNHEESENRQPEIREA